MPTLVQVIFYFHSFSQPLASSTILTTCKIKLHFFPILLICPIYTTSLYFTMARGKLPPIFSPNTLKSMIEYTLISNILVWNDNKTLGMSKRWHSVTPLPAFARNHNMGNIMEKNNWQNKWMGGLAMGKCKNGQRKFCITKTNCKHFEGGYGRLPLGNVYTCHGFF